MHFWSIKGIYFLQNANNLYFKLFLRLYKWPTKQVFCLYLRRISDNESFWISLKSTFLALKKKLYKLSKLPFTKQNQAEVWPRFQSLLKVLLWTRGVNGVNALNAFGNVCYRPLSSIGWCKWYVILMSGGLTADDSPVWFADQGGRLGLTNTTTALISSLPATLPPIRVSYTTLHSALDCCNVQKMRWLCNY